MAAFVKVSDRVVSVNSKTPVAICLDKREGSHVGLIFWCQQPHANVKNKPCNARELHLLDDQFLKTLGVDLETVNGKMLIALLGDGQDDDFNRIGALAGQLEILADKKGVGIALGPAWLNGVGYFDDDGVWLDEGGMLTCATFVREALLAFGVDIIEKSDWRKGHADDIAWKNTYIEKYQKNNKLNDERKAMLIKGILALDDSQVQRLIPADMAYAGSLSPDEWPVNFDRAHTGGTKLIEQYKGTFPTPPEDVPTAPAQ